MIAYFFLGRHVVEGVKWATIGCWWMITADFSDPKQVNFEYSRHFNEWDKLWLVPAAFTQAFTIGFKRSMDWG